MNKKILNSIYWVFMSVITLSLISFSSKKQAERKCEKITISIDKQLQKYFIDEDDINAIISEGNRKIIKGLSKEAINIKYLESLVEENKFVKNAEVSINHKGDIHIKVEQNIPAARIFTSDNSFYINESGKRLPLSSKYTARVPLVISELEEINKKIDFFTSEEGKSYIFLLNHIRADEFWSKQIAELHINKYGEVSFLMQLGKQKVEFGKPQLIEDKFFRLSVFVKKIMPSVGWNKYEKVSLRYKGQIVCE